MMPPATVQERGHWPVLLEETLAGLAPRPGGIFVDATYGRGGHAARLLEQLDGDGRLLLLDRDPEAVADAEQRFGTDSRVVIRRAAFGALAEVVADLGWTGRIDGLMADLGLSSPQVDDPQRGFSFSAAGPVDMRMDPDCGESAAEWLARAEEGEIARVLRDYGEERFAKRIARALVRERERDALTDTAHLAEVIKAAVPGPPTGRHPATRSFQAIRVHVNGELEQLEQLLDALPDLIRPGGRIALISFHSLEDRRVKRFIRGGSDAPKVVGGVPLPDTAPPPFRSVGRARRAEEREAEQNPRARSAVLRVAERRE